MTMLLAVVLETLILTGGVALAAKLTLGDDGDNTLKGTKRADYMEGRCGSDTMNGGDDEIWDEDGDDTISGGSGSDTVYGEEGNDFIHAADNASETYPPDYIDCGETPDEFDQVVADENDVTVDCEYVYVP